MTIRFPLNDKKLVETIVWLAHRYGPIDIFHIAKTIFYADKAHLNKYGRPITGDRYVAMTDGPVPSKIYNLIKGEFPYVGAEELEAMERALEFQPNSAHPTVRARRPAQTKCLSETDVECLTEAAEKYARMPMSELWDLVHNEPAYIAARKKGGGNPDIDFENMIDLDTPDRDEIIEEIREAAPSTIL